VSLIMGGHLQALSRVSAIERRARSFPDPIDRLRYLRQATGAATKYPSRRTWTAWCALALLLLTWRSDAIVRHPSGPVVHAPSLVRPVSEAAPNIWPVEQNSDYDLYSNGLRIENRLAISNQPRSYYLIARGTGARGPLRAQPAGIVFHISESAQAPFEREQKRVLKRIGEELLLYVRNKRAYHFVIDRFGRVYRIVVESDAANHAGHSVWADSKWSYVDLNDSFLGVAFEARTQPDQVIVTEGQLRSARALTEMLRAKYNLLAENCVVHAQVSVNPINWRIGWHTDWGVGFPFREIGLPNNYQIPNPGLYLFGFNYDAAYSSATGPDLWEGLTAGEERVREAAAERGLTPADYRKVLQQRFRDALSAVQHENAGEENQNESN
jgi:N-acetylmuramoyl-L-alanine amidase